MRFTGEVYRHPIEANTPLLEVTAGCSHNKCSFCTMYRKTPFKVSPIEHIKEDLEELKSYNEEITRICLVNADPFVLSTNKLVLIGELINEYFPNIKTITCYASINNIKNKSIDDLKKLRSLGYNQLHIGIESVYDDALKIMNKGYTSSDVYQQIEKLVEAGFEYDALLMLGVAGKGNTHHIKHTTDFLNKFNPYMISIMPTSVTPGSELETICDNKEYIELTEKEMLLEEIEFLKSLKVYDECFFFGSHYFNLIPVSGTLKEKNKIIAYLENAITNTNEKILNSTKPRGAI